MYILKLVNHKLGLMQFIKVSIKTGHILGVKHLKNVFLIECGVTIKLLCD